jgi:hypothetical protein
MSPRRDVGPVRGQPEADLGYYVVERGRRFASRGGGKRKGALVRSIILDPTVYGVTRVLDPGMTLHPLIPMAIGSGGSGGEVRLKLWLSLLYRFNSKEKWFDLDEVDPKFMAGMFGLPDPATKGAARVRDAFRWLASNGFIEIEGGRLKKTGRVRVISEVAQFLPDKYRDVVRTSPAGKTESAPDAEIPAYSDSYTRVPGALWANGWMGYLKASELMVLLILCKLSQNGRYETVAVKASTRLKRFGLSDSMWRQGLVGLQDRGIIRSFEPAKHKTDPIEFRAYDFQLEVVLKDKSIDVALSGPVDHERNVSISEKLTRRSVQRAD